jgi:aspartyl-tRNA(Asn)/glutamyl-tRNA(Gln) amidotransferase subunit A
VADERAGTSGAGGPGGTDGGTGAAGLHAGAVGIAQAVRRGELRAQDVLEEHLAVVEAREPALHCFLALDVERARASAAALDEAVARGEAVGALAGVPVVLKDNLCVPGLPATCGSRILEGWVPPYEATVAARLRKAGALLVGKTNLDEFAMGSSTEHSAFGATANPHDPERVPGGSSGGSAAAVAAGMAPIGLGSDTGGSIRQPAALCGVVGVKPTYGLVSRYGLIAFASSLDQIGPLTASVADAALALEVIAGADPADSTCLDRPAPVLGPVLGRGVEGLRVGVVGDLVEGADREVAAAVAAAADRLAGAGAKVDEVAIPACRYGLPAYYLLAPAEASSNLARYDGVRYGLRVEGEDVAAMNAATRAAGFGREVRRRIMLGTFALSAGYYDAYYGQAQRVRTLMIQAFADAYQRFDVLLGATTPGVAFHQGEKLADPLSMYLSDVFTVPSNLTGQPALSVPFGTGESGLPVGVQVLAPALGEEVLFQVGSSLEAMAPRGGADGAAGQGTGQEAGGAAGQGTGGR